MLHSSELPRFKNFTGSVLLSLAVGWFLWPLPLLALLVNRGKIAMPPRWLTLAIVTPVAVLSLWWLMPVVWNNLLEQERAHEQQSPAGRPLR